MASVRLAEKASAGCGLASWGGQVYLAWTGTDYRLNLASSPDGTSFGAKQSLRARSYKYVRGRGTDSISEQRAVALGPAVAGAGRQVHMAWTASNHELQLVPGDRAAEARPVGIGQHSLYDPAMAAAGTGALVLCWSGTDRRVNLLTMDGGPPSRALRLEEAKSDAGPAVCTYGRGVLVAWTGTDRRVNLMTVSDGQPSRPIRLDDVKSWTGPGLCSHGDGAVLAWTGSDRRVNLRTLSGGAWGPSRRLADARSDAAPAICSYRGDVLLAWTGGDMHLNVAYSSWQ